MAAHEARVVGPRIGHRVVVTHLPELPQRGPRVAVQRLHGLHGLHRVGGADQAQRGVAAVASRQVSLDDVQVFFRLAGLLASFNLAGGSAEVFSIDDNVMFSRAKGEFLLHEAGEFGKCLAWLLNDAQLPYFPLQYERCRERVAKAIAGWVEPLAATRLSVVSPAASQLENLREPSLRNGRSDGVAAQGAVPSH